MRTCGRAVAPAAFRPHGRDLRASADGVFVYGEAGRREIALADGGKYSGRHNVLDDMRAAILTGRPPVHDARWGKATVEVALAIQQSARERREVVLAHQVAVRDEKRAG